MLYVYPEGTTATVIRAYRPPYPDPIAVAVGDVVVPDLSRRTDVVGWVWCTGPDGRAGWTPEAWIDSAVAPWRMRRSFRATELGVDVGDRVRLHHAESGFVWCERDGRSGWLPDGVLRLDH